MRKGDPLTHLLLIRYVTEGSRSFDPIAIVAGIIQTIIYADFGYIVSPLMACLHSPLTLTMSLRSSFPVCHKVRRPISRLQECILTDSVSAEYSVAKNSNCPHRCNRHSIRIDPRKRRHNDGRFFGNLFAPIWQCKIISRSRFLPRSRNVGICRLRGMLVNVDLSRLHVDLRLSRLTYRRMESGMLTSE